MKNELQNCKYYQIGNLISNVRFRENIAAFNLVN